jgi:hypothetical protein
MPDCSVYIGPSVISLSLFFEDPTQKPVFYTYPYSFINQYHTEEQKKKFIDELLSAFLADQQLDSASVNCVFCSFYEDFIFRNYKKALGMYGLYTHDTGNFFCANGAVISHGNSLFASPYLKANLVVSAESEKLNAIANAELYPFNFVNDEFSKGLYDDCILYLSSLLNVSPQQKENPYETGHDVTFTGDRFTYYSFDKESIYLLMLDLIDKVGIYRVKVDTNNVVTHTKNMERTKDKFTTNTKSQIFSVGTIVKLNSAAECYVETHIGTKQVFQLQQNGLITIPLPVGEKAKITVKMAGTNTFESQVVGGTLGIVFYNYEKKKDLFAGLTQTYAKEAKNIIREGLLELS